MKEIGGYIELDHYRGEMLHNGLVALNCGRNALGYILKSRNIKKILIPLFLCSSVSDVCKKYKVEIRYYSIESDFFPKNIILQDDEWLYVVNYYGQLSDDKLKELKRLYDRVILDNAQAYFQMPVEGVDTLYTCRKFFGVADGAFLYTDSYLNLELPTDESFDRMTFLLGRFEKNAQEFYGDYTKNNHLFNDQPIKKMSKLTENLLHGIDYDFVKERRTENFVYLHKQFKDVNMLSLLVPQGAFMYPLYIENGAEIRKKLQIKHIYVPTLWPDVFDSCGKDRIEYDMALNILPLPIDQRYSVDDMKYISEVIRNV